MISSFRTVAYLAVPKFCEGTTKSATILWPLNWSKKLLIEEKDSALPCFNPFINSQVAIRWSIFLGKTRNEKHPRQTSSPRATSSAYTVHCTLCFWWRAQSHSITLCQDNEKKPSSLGVHRKAIQTTVLAIRDETEISWCDGNPYQELVVLVNISRGKDRRKRPTLIELIVVKLTSSEYVRFATNSSKNLVVSSINEPCLLASTQVNAINSICCRGNHPNYKL